MTTHTKRLVLVVVPFLLSCRTSPRQFTTADEQAVRDMADTTVAAFKAANFGPWLDLWTDDAILQPPNAQTVIGRDGRVAWSKAFPPLDDLRFGNVRVTGDGNLAYGTTTYMLKPKGMPADSGKQLFIARRQADGKWKLVAGSFNSDLPAPVGASTFTAADSSAIIALNARLERTARSHHWDAWTAEFAADPTRMPPDMKAVVGRTAVDAFNRSAPNVTAFDIRVTSIIGNSNIAIATGEYRAVIAAGKDAAGKATPPITEDGKFMQELTRQPDRSWKIARDIWNSNVPVASAASK